MSDANRTEAVGKVAGDVEAVGDAARQTGQQAKRAGADALDQAQDVAQEAKARGTSALSAVGEQASAMAETQKGNLAEQIEDVAKAVHKSGEQLEGHQDWIAKLVEQGADELTGIAERLRSNDLQSLLRDLGSLARRQPALFVGASMAAGFALTRIGRVAVSDAPTSDTSGSQPHGSPSQPSAPPSPPYGASPIPGSSPGIAPTPAAPTVGSGPVNTGEAGRERS